jgi:tryptophan halogenase
MQNPTLQHILIIGGGTAGWMTAAALAHKVGSLPITISLIESDAIGTVGVGEATVPHIRFFNQTLGIDEAEFMRATKATFKLGIEFKDWGRIGDSYLHPFGAYGEQIGGVDFHQHWLRLHRSGDAADLGDYSLPVQAAMQNRFAAPAEDSRSLLSTYSYAYQFDAGLYGRFLRHYAEQRGVRRFEGRIVDVQQNGDSGAITEVRLDSGEKIAADLFVDCSGFRGLLINQQLKAAFESWAHWLPCDRAIAVPCQGAGELSPYTRATARGAGWMWRIPLQHRTGNGHVYCSSFLSDDEAERELLEQLEGPALASPNRLHFEAGRRTEQWKANCVAIGLASGFLEPLESTSIHLIQLGISKLLELLPLHGSDPLDAAEYNRSLNLEYERIRDFLILHYCATQRDDTAFWDHCRTMSLPASLEEKIALFRERGVVAPYRHGMFLEPSWLAVYLGQRIVPERYDRRSDAIAASDLRAHLAGVENACRMAAQSLPKQRDYLAQIAGLADPA